MLRFLELAGVSEDVIALLLLILRQLQQLSSVYEQQESLWFLPARYVNLNEK